MNTNTDYISRCVNLDWLEVTALEPLSKPHDAEYFRSCGWVVIERDYGTRVWSQMFTLEGTDHLPFLEVRRGPKSQIIAHNVCHLRFVNRVCYFPNAAQLMSDFIAQYDYEFQRLSRIDICLDLERFDSGDYPKDFMRRFMEGVYSKINQGNISAHGSDEWSGRVWNSLSWGSPTSDIGTKFYNKTLELYDPVTKHYTKPYIRQSWAECGLVDDPINVIKYKPNGEAYTPQIWRIEFSIRSSVKNWFVINLNGKEKQKQSIRNTLDMYNGREKILVLFASLAEHYFHFKYVIKRYNFYKEGKTDGYALRKDKCPDKVLFRWKTKTFLYKVAKDSVATSEKCDMNLARLLSQLKAFRDTTSDVDIKKSASTIIQFLENRISHYDQTNPINRHEMKVLQMALKDHMDRPYIDPALLIKLAREEMKIRDGIDVFI